MTYSVPTPLCGMTLKAKRTCRCVLRVIAIRSVILSPSHSQLYIWDNLVLHCCYRHHGDWPKRAASANNTTSASSQLVREPFCRAVGNECQPYLVNSCSMDWKETDEGSHLDTRFVCSLQLGDCDKRKMLANLSGEQIEMHTSRDCVNWACARIVITFQKGNTVPVLAHQNPSWGMFREFCTISGQICMLRRWENSLVVLCKRDAKV